MDVYGEDWGPQEAEDKVSPQGAGEPDQRGDGVGGDADHSEADSVPMVSEPPTAEGYPQPPTSEWDPQQWTEPSLESPARPVAGVARRGRAVVAAVLAGLLLLSAGIGIGWGLSRSQNGSSSLAEAPLGTVPQGGSSAGGRELTAQAIADKVDPAVVDVNTVLGAFGPGGQATAQAAGTGVILTASGEVLTNNHVIAGATSIKVTVQGHGGYTATVIGADPPDDVALLQVQGGTGLPIATLADSSSLTVGQRVVAIGNALGRGGPPTVTEGNVSALGRALTVGNDNGRQEHLTKLIQTDAPISPGESGGPLVNEASQVVGVITAAAATGPFQRVSNESFAIPANAAVGIVNQIRAGHATSSIVIGQPGFLGVQVRDLDATTAAQLGLGVTSGALVVRVIPATPAAGAGMPGDAVITAIDGQRITSAQTLGPAIYTHKPGQQIQETWVDGSGIHTATVTLIAGPAV
jgi:S1-C subfamily serine protease